MIARLEANASNGNKATCLVLLLWVASTSMIILWRDVLGTGGWANWQEAVTVGPSNGSFTPSRYVDVQAPFRLNVTYKPSASEEYVLTHAEELGFLATSVAELTIPSCDIFTNPEIPIFNSLQQYRSELAEYNRKADAYTLNFTDLRKPLRQGMSRDAVCDTLDLGLPGIFKSQQLSYGSFGYAEPLIPPLRHPDYCFNHRLFDLTYLINDWKTLCQRLTPFSRTVFIDMGASLMFHQKEKLNPAVYVLNIYNKFGFPFDHVYAYEITNQEPAQVFQMVPDDLLHSYHWINVGVESDPNGKMNPLRMLLEEYTEEDFVVIKLDIDTGFIEVPLARQLLEDDRFNRLVDVFYFEHHVHQYELQYSWTDSMEGSLKESLDLFHGLRKKGIAAHYWV